MFACLRALQVAAFCVGLAVPASIVKAEDDPEFTAMPDGPGKEFVYLVCADCHSMTHVLQRGYTYTRRDWRASLQRMTDEFGMAALTSDETNEIVSYLVNSARTASRR